MTYAPTLNRRSRRAARVKTARPAIELLEDRCLLATFSVNLTADAADANTADGICDIDLGSAGQQCSWRAAIQQANATAETDSTGDGMPDPDQIAFNIPANDTGHVYYRDDGVAGSVATSKRARVPASATSDNDLTNAAIADTGPDAVVGEVNTIDPDWSHSWWQIAVASGGLPEITGAVVLDGYSQPGASANTNTVESLLGLNTALRVELNGANAGSTDGLLILAGRSTVRGLAINRFQRSGIFLQSGNENIIQGNLIGLDPSGAISLGNGRHGVESDSSNHTIGGTTAAARNVISGNVLDGVEIRGGTNDNNRVQGNLIGTDLTGTLDRGNGLFGVELHRGLFGGTSSNNTIGGAAGGARNVISGNEGGGVSIHTPGTVSTNNIVQGNFIGTDVTGGAPLGNRHVGVRFHCGIDSSPATGTRIVDNVIAATFDPDGNNGSGIVLGASVASVGCPGNGTTIQGNRIGTSADGSVALGNAGEGILVQDGAGNMIGGTGFGQGNIIAHNGRRGIYVGGSGTGNAIVGNAIFANGQLGIDISGNGVTPNDADDAGDADTGPNNLQNFPVLTSATGSSI